jgi:hypothetical protein
LLFAACSNNKELLSAGSGPKKASVSKAAGSGDAEALPGGVSKTDAQQGVAQKTENGTLPSPLSAASGSAVVPNAASGAVSKVFTGPKLPLAGSVFSRAYAIDSHTFYSTFPRKPGECSEEIHAEYWVKGKDGKIYPTWHPPVHPSGCKFGHEHGTDPSTSTLFADIGSPPFGYAQEQYEPNRPELQRSQPHVGYKIELANNFQAKDNLPNVKCSVMNMFHHETFSTDGLVNPLHEFFYDAKCTDGLEIHWKSLNNMGKPGEFHERCAGASFEIVTLKNPILNPRILPPGDDSTLGSRSINDWHNCIKPRVIDQDQGFGISERWIFEAGAQHDLGLEVGFAITDAPVNPGRYGHKEVPEGMQFMIELCKMKDWDECKEVKAKKLAWHDVGNPWNGESRFTRPMWILNLQNKSGKTKWYTDVFGKKVSPTPFEGSIEQHFSLANQRIEGYSAPDTWKYVVPANGVRLPN